MGLPHQIKSFTIRYSNEVSSPSAKATASTPGPMWQATDSESGCISISYPGKASFTSSFHSRASSR